MKANAKYNLGCAYSCLEGPQTFGDDGASITPRRISIRTKTYWTFTYQCSACRRSHTIPAKTILHKALLNEVVNRCKIYRKIYPDTKPLDAVHQCAKEERKFFVTRELWDEFAKEMKNRNEPKRGLSKRNKPSKKKSEGEGWESESEIQKLEEKAAKTKAASRKAHLRLLAKVKRAKRAEREGEEGGGEGEES